MDSNLQTKTTIDQQIPTGTAGLGRFLQLLSVLQRTKGAAPACGIFAFTSAIRGEGVSYVAGTLARELALLPRERVLLVTASVLSTLTPRDLDEKNGALRETSPHFWTAPAVALTGRTINPDLQGELLEALRDQFSYVLIDCRALKSSPEILRIASQVDGVVLVVGAGQSRRDQVQQAQRVLQLASDKLLGCVLNRRTYPIPSFLQKYVEGHHGTEHDSTIS